MLKTVTVINYKGEQKVMDLRNPESSGFLVYDISGLGPGKATINMTEITSYNGAIYNSSRLGTRNIVIPLKYMWANTIEESRYASYKYFPLMTKVKLIFETDNRLLAIDGYVESNEPAIFDQMSYTQISILCEDPYFYSYENGGTQVVNAPHAYNVPTYFDYNGDIDTGFDIYLEPHEAYGPREAPGDYGNCIAIYVSLNRTWKGYILISETAIEQQTGHRFMEGDIFHFCTRKGHKSATLTRGNNTYNVFSCLTRVEQEGQEWVNNQYWPILSYGENGIRYPGRGLTSYGDWNVDGRIEYKELYSGV